MTLEQLSYEYIKEADRLKARLCELKIMLKKAQTEQFSSLPARQC